MADDLLYHFSDEDDDEDALLDRAFDRWEQMRGGSAPVDGFRQRDNLRRGLPVQQHQAQELHRQAGVAEGPVAWKSFANFNRRCGPNTNYW